MLNHYPLHNTDVLQNYLEAYIPLVQYQLDQFGIDIKRETFHGDHLGLQVLSSQEFDEAHSLITQYAKTIKQGRIHDRRNNTYKLNQFIKAHDVQIQSIEMFEPKPDADLNKLKPGFEHISIFVQDYDNLYTYFVENNLPISKSVDLNGSRFFKTKFVNLVEVEFRDSYLWEALEKDSINA
jgi:predicted metalloenzyme YecM